jgi:flagellar hook-basal body complex protein FliE
MTAPTQAITAINPVGVADGVAGASAARGGSFVSVLSAGLDKVNQQLISADSLATRFAVDDSVPVHQVTFALEQARMSAEILLQVRSALLSSYQELFRMQL